MLWGLKNRKLIALRQHAFADRILIVAAVHGYGIQVKGLHRCMKNLIERKTRLSQGQFGMLHRVSTFVYVVKVMGLDELCYRHRFITITMFHEMLIEVIYFRQFIEEIA